MDRPDFNSQEFIDKIKWFGPGRNPFGSNFRVKKKMERGGSFEVQDNHQQIRVTYEEASDWNLSPILPDGGGGHFGFLVVVAWVSRLGRWCSWNIEHLRLSTERTSTSSVNTKGWPEARDWVDVIAQKTNSPDSKFRFADKDWFGLAIVAHPDGEPHQSNVRSDIFRVRYRKSPFDVDVPTRPDKGKPWNIGEVDHPQFVMGPTPNFMDSWDPHDFVQEQIVETGFNGVHIPMQGMWHPKILDLLDLADHHGFIVHLWLYGDFNSNTAPENPNSESARHFQESVAAELRPYNNWTMGLGYDLHEWAPNTNDVGGFVHFHRVGLSMTQPYGGRYLPVERGPYPGQFISVEQQVTNKALFRVQLSEVLDDKRPVITSDRFRVRAGNREKDWSLAQIPQGIRDCLEMGVSAIWGYGNEVSDTGSRPWPNKDAIAEVLGGDGDVPPPPPPPPSPPSEGDDEGYMVVNAEKLESFRLSAGPDIEDHEHMWGKEVHWPAEEGTVIIRVENPLSVPVILWGIGTFIGMEADKQDEITAEPRVYINDSIPSGKILPSKIEEKDSPGMAFDASDALMLPFGIRVQPGGVFEAKFDHVVTGEDNQPYDHDAHASITFFCYRDE